MSKKLTKDAMTAYQRARRARIRAALDVNPSCKASVKPAAPVAPCANCAELAAEVSRLTAELEAHGRKAAPASNDETETLCQQVISDKVNRINNFAKGHVIGSARI